MLELIFNVGQAISLAVLIYGAYLSIDYTFFSESWTRAQEQHPEGDALFNL